MLRLILMMVLLGVGFPSFSEEFRHDLKDWQYESLNDVGYGSAHLLAHEPWQALEYFQKASALLDKSDPSSPIISFLISFCQVVAYDSLGFQEQCKQAIGSLFLAINGYNEGESIETNQEPGFNYSQDYESSLEFLRNLATIAPSFEVRELLFSIIDEIAEEQLPVFEFAKSPFLGKPDWVFDYGTDNVSAIQCKSWWKKLKKWSNEVLEFLHLAEKATKAAKEIKKNIDDMRSSNQYQDPRYLNPDYRIN